MFPLTWHRTRYLCVRLLFASIVAAPRCFGSDGQKVTLMWDHDPGPYSYNIYESTNLLAFPVCWVLKTNVSDLQVQLEICDTPRFFTVTCMDTNTGDESGFAIK